MRGQFIKSILRRKHINLSEVESTDLSRCLGTWDLTALGIGSTLGLGVYVLAGVVSQRDAGPSVILSFLVAALASVCAGLCYAEFGSRVPKAGSAYIYSYVTVGELLAFIIGWNLILEYIIGTASVAKGYSGYLDQLTGKAMSKTFYDLAPLGVSWLSPYPDFFAFGMTMLLSVLLAVGVSESAKFNNVFTCVNLLVIVYVVVCGAFKADFRNWTIKKENIPAHVKHGGKGGFFPFGVSGMLSGAATCFFGFVGFDAVATTGEEVRNPQRAIPISIISSLFCVFFAYFSISSVLTLMVPYYDQNVDAPLPHAFDYVHWPVAKWIVSIGALAGLSTSLLGSMFPLPRVIYAMANDGLLYRFLARIDGRFKTPFLATIISGFLAAVLSAIFKLEELVDMMSIGTLLAYTLVAVSVLIIRYSDDDCVTEDQDKCRLLHSIDEDDSSSDQSDAAIIQPSRTTSRVSKLIILFIIISVLALDCTLIFAESYLESYSWWAMSLVVLCALSIIFLMIALSRLPTNQTPVKFKVPMVPFIPCASVLVNVYLMMKLSSPTWIRFGIWMAIGFFVYFTYGIRNSSQEIVRYAVAPSAEDLSTSDSPPAQLIHDKRGRRTVN